jgi:hypothetical protein
MTWRPATQRNKIMKKWVLAAAVAALSFVSAQAAFAQAAISEPGLYSFYHPSGDLLGYGARTIRPGASSLGVTGASRSLALAPLRTTHGRRHLRVH